jgi:hypothetical protein
MLAPSASPNLFRAAAEALRPERGELEEVLREGPLSPGAQRFGAVAPPDAPPDAPPADPPRAPRGRAAGALVVGFLVGVMGLAQASDRLPATMQNALSRGAARLGLGMGPPPVADEPSTCAMPDAPSPDGTTSSGRSGRAPSRGGGGVGAAGPAGGDAAVMSLAAATPHPNPRLIRTVAGGELPPSEPRDAASQPQSGGLGALAPSLMGGTGAEPASAAALGGSSPAPPTGSGPSGTDLPTGPASGGTGSALQGTAVQPSLAAGPGPTAGIQMVPTTLPIDVDTFHTTCPVWPGEPAAQLPPGSHPQAAERHPSSPTPSSGPQAGGGPGGGSPASPRPSAMIPQPSPSPRAQKAPSTPQAPSDPSGSGAERPAPAPARPAAAAPNAAQPPPATAREALMDVIWGEALGPQDLPECEPDGP